MPGITLLNVFPFLCGITAFAIYLASLAPSITWAQGSSDSGELVTAAYYLGVAHPTGYPAFVLLGWLFSHLPIGENIAFRVNLLSAVAASVAVTLLALLALRVGRHWPTPAGAMGAAAGALLLAFSPMFWSQAVVTEVYALNALFVLLLLLIQESRLRDPGALGSVGLLGLVLGAGAANHITILLLAPGTVPRLWPLVKHSPTGALRGLVLLGGGLLLGLSLYLLLPLRAGTAPPFASWGDVQSPQAFLDHITAAAYRPSLFSLPPELALSKVPALARLLLEQFGWAGYCLALLGIWSMARQDKGLLASWTCSVLLYVGFALNYPVLDSQVYLMPFFVLTALAIGQGTAMLFAEVADRASARTGSTLALGLLVAALLAGGFLTSRPNVDRSQDWEAWDYAKATLDALPEGALLAAREDKHTFSLWYLQYVEGYRRDVVIVDARVLLWPWYQRNLVRTYPGLAFPSTPLSPLNALRMLIVENAGQRPVYLTFESSAFTIAREGDLYRVVDASRPAGS